jgi:hypothetical protein
MAMNIVVGSAFRNMSSRINRYFKQVHALAEHIGPDHSVRVIAVEGDSVDETERELVHMAELWQLDTSLRKHDHGHPPFGSTEEPLRLEALSGVMLEIFKAVKKEDDVLLYVESDLIWKPHEVGSIIDIAFEQREGFDIVAPMVWAGEAFYDIWGFRGLDGQRFSPFEPYHEDLPLHGIGEISSAGSCLAMRAEVAMKVRPTNNKKALVGWCKAARAKKYRIGCAVDFEVHQP